MSSLGELSLTLEARTKAYEAALAQASRYTKITAEDMKKLEAMDLKKATASLNEISRSAKALASESKAATDALKSTSGVDAFSGQGKENIQKLLSGMSALSNVVGIQAAPAVGALAGAMNIADGAIKSVEASTGVAVVGFRAMAGAIWTVMAPIAAMAAGIAGAIVLVSELKKGWDAVFNTDKTAENAADYSQSVRELAKVMSEVKQSYEGGPFSGALPSVEVKSRYTEQEAADLYKASEAFLNSSFLLIEQRKKIASAHMEAMTAGAKVQRDILGETDLSTNKFVQTFKETFGTIVDDLRGGAFKSLEEAPKLFGPMLGEDEAKRDAARIDAVYEQQKKREEESAKQRKKLDEEVAKNARELDEKARDRIKQLAVQAEIEEKRRQERLSDYSKRLDSAAKKEMEKYVKSLPSPAPNAPTIGEMISANTPLEFRVSGETVGKAIDQAAPKSVGLVQKAMTGYAEGSPGGIMAGLTSGWMAVVSDLLVNSKGFQKVMQSLEGIFQVMVGIFDQAIGPLTEVALALSKLLEVVVRALAPIFLILVNLFSGLVGLLTPIIEGITIALTEVWNGFIKAIGSLLRSIDKILPGDKLKDMAKRMERDYLIPPLEELGGAVDEVTSAIDQSLNGPNGFKVNILRFLASAAEKDVTPGPGNIAGRPAGVMDTGAATGGIVGILGGASGNQTSNGLGLAWSTSYQSPGVTRPIVIQNVSVNNPSNLDGIISEASRKADNIVNAKAPIAPAGSSSISTSSMTKRAVILNPRLAFGGA